MCAHKAVSVIIPNLDSPTVDRTLDSLRSQSLNLDRVEILVVGQDRHRLVTQDQRVRCIHTERPCIQSIARNIGASQAHGDILAFIDADCVADPDWLQVLTARFRDHRVQVMGGGVAFAAGRYWTLCDNIAMLYEWVSTAPPGTRPYLASLNLAMRRTVWQELGGFDETFVKAEDTELSIRARRAGHTLHFEPRAIVSHEPAPERNRVDELLRRAFESGYWTLHAFLRYQKDAELPSIYRRGWLMLLLAPLTAGGVMVKIFRHRALRRFWYALPGVYASRLVWRLGGAYRLFRGTPGPQMFPSRFAGAPVARGKR